MSGKFVMAVGKKTSKRFLKITLIFFLSAVISCATGSNQLSPAGPSEESLSNENQSEDSSAAQIESNFSPFSEKENPSNNQKKSSKNKALKNQNDERLRKKIGQLFVIRPESIDSRITAKDLVQNPSRGTADVSSKMAAFYKKYPAGGFCIFARNIRTPVQLKIFTKQLHGLNPSKSPLLYIDEEGGVVARLANSKGFNLPQYKNMKSIGDTNNTDQAFSAGKNIGSYLKQYGFDIDFAPVADVNTNPDNPIIGSRAFSSNPVLAGKMDVAFLKGLHSAGVLGCLKHWPGHGDTKTDTHVGYAETNKTWAQLKNCEVIPFKAGIENNVQIIMAAHISAPKITGNYLPATLSKTLLTEKLRKELGFKGVIITDAMEMGAIAKNYSSGEAAVRAIKAGADIILMPLNYVNAFEGVLAAVKSGEISEQRIDESIMRIENMRKSLTVLF